MFTDRAFLAKATRTVAAGFAAGIVTFAATTAPALAQDDTPRYLRPEALAAEEALLELRYGASPDEAYNRFNEFVKQVFGAECEPLIYEKYGDELTLVDTGAWRYASQRSAAIAYETNLPAVSYIEYGPTEALGRQTEPTDRHYFLHIHHVTGLEPGTTVHYRLVAEDERGNVLRSDIETIETQAEGSFTLIGEDHDGGPIVIDQPGKYLLARDITSTRSGINIEADDVTLDLGGHTIHYGSETLPDDHFTDKWRSYEITGSIGVRNMGHSGFTLINGTIMQAPTETFKNAGNDDTSGFNPVFIRDTQNVEVAGVVVDYNSRQNTGMMNRNAGDNHLFHHNVIRDRGLVVRNRHGAACRAIHFFSPDGENHAVRHNLVARARQNGLGLSVDGSTLTHNEVYIDSWSTNSFAIGPPDNTDPDAPGVHGNKVFATGFNPYGFGWGREHLRIHDNLVYMHGLNTTHRWHEDWGDVDLLAAFRVTNYSGGGQERNDLQFFDNLVIMRAKGGADIQGTRFFSDESVEGLVFRDNIIKTERLDDQPAPNSGAIVAHGYFRKDNTVPVLYENNTLISNRILVQFGEAYARGNKHYFHNNRFVRFGDRDDFATFRFGGRYHSKAHRVVDGTFEGGAAPDDVWWHQTGDQSHYTVAWTLTIEADAGTSVQVEDAHGQQVFHGKVGGDGKLAIELDEATYRPGDGPRQSEVTRHTPHIVTLGGQEQERKVEMTGPRTLNAR